MLGQKSEVNGIECYLQLNCDFTVASQRPNNFDIRPFLSVFMRDSRRSKEVC